MKRKFQLTESDVELFREAVKGTRRYRHDKVVVSPEPIPTRPRRRLRDEPPVQHDMLSDEWEPADLEEGEELLYARHGLQHGVLRKLRRGQYGIGAELDLHGMSVKEARQALTQFLHYATHHCVRIVHGKGNSSQNQLPVLKGKVNNWLRQRDDVLAFCSARTLDGGTGALYVLLRGRKGR